MSDSPDTATPLRAWLDERRAEIEHDHQDSWTGRPDQCYCDLTKPCPDRTRELAAVDGLIVALNELEDARAVVALFLARAGGAVTFTESDMHRAAEWIALSRFATAQPSTPNGPDHD